MLKAGRLRHRITLQRREETQDPTSGASVSSWVDVATVWAEIAPLSAREFIAAQGVQSSITTRITIRYRAGIDHTMRAVHNGTIYNIQGVLPDPGSGREYLTLPCSQGANDG